MKLDHFTTMRGYQLAATKASAPLIDAMLNGDQGDSIRDRLKLKRIQFDAVASLAEELESVCGLLDCSKRQFLEGAVWEALDKAKTAYFETLETIADEGGPQLHLRQVEEA